MRFKNAPSPPWAEESREASGGFTGSQSDLNHDGEIDYKDMTLGALLGAVGAHGLAKAYRGEKVPIGLSIDDPKKANFFEGLGELSKAENLAPKILQRLDDAKIVDTLIGHKVYQNKGYMQAPESPKYIQYRQQTAYQTIE